MTAPRRRWFRFSLRTLFTAVAVLGCFYGYRLWCERFNRASWRDPAICRSGVRRPMADGLVARHTLTGLSRPAVVDMLGEPEPLNSFVGWDIDYLLGDERGFGGIDSEWLVIRFDKSGCVVDYRVVTD